MVHLLLKGKIREAKDNYKRKLVWKLQQNSMRKVWKAITGFGPINSRGAGGGEDRANELYVFFNRFITAMNDHHPSDLPLVSV